MRNQKLTRGLSALVCALAAFFLFQWLSPGAARQGPSAAWPVAMDPAAIGLRVDLDASHGQAAAWEGEITVSPGKVERLEIWEGGPGSRVEGGRFLRRAARRRAQSGMPRLFATLSAPSGAQVELKTSLGAARFSLTQLSAGQPVALFGGAAQVHPAPAVFRLTPPGQDDDFPAAAVAPDGSVWVAYVSYRRSKGLDEQAIQQRQFDSLVPANHGDSIFLIQYDGGQWGPPLEVTEELGDAWRPTLATDSRGVVWVTWSQQRGGNWDLYQRRWDPGKKQWSAIDRLTTDPGADINVASVRDSKGQVWWAWQAWRGNNFNILLASPGGGPPVAVAESPANEWNPAMAADSAGNVYVGWDTYEKGDYDVFVRRFGSRPTAPLAVADTEFFEARVSLTCDPSDRLWIAYEEDEPNWGKDYAGDNPNVPIRNLGAPLYLKRRIRVKALAGDRLLAPADAVPRAHESQPDRPSSFPRLMADASGGVWLLFRHHARPAGTGEVWAGSLTRFDGRQWSQVGPLPASDSVLDSRPAMVPWEKQGVLAVYSSDGRLRAAVGEAESPENALFAAVLSGPPVSEPQLAATESSRPSPRRIHPEEDADVARLRGYRIELAGKTYRLLRGEFHRHTEFTSHRDQDGALEDLWRYGLDAAAMDWIGNGDHDNGRGREYSWWIIQKVTDIFHHPPHFVPPFTHERSVVYPNGHRNVMFSQRGVRPLPRGPLPGTPEQGTPDTKLLYAYLHQFRGLCAIHTSGTGMGTDWRDNDPEVEPVVEIYQGHRHNYEHYGAPRSATPQTQIGGYQPAGFIWNAWARGYRLGVQSSSDHVSTHTSYAIALAEEPSREALVDAFRKRHCYAATDNIILDVRAGDHLMGDEFHSAHPVRLAVKAVGTRPIRRVVIVRDSGYVYETNPSGPQAEFNWQDNNQPAGTLSYYYVRVEQEDGQLAWSSPIWVRYE